MSERIDELISEIANAASSKAGAYEWGSGTHGAERELEEAKDKLRAEIASLETANAESEQTIERLRTWVSDLHSGMYINCVYCGHRYGPDPGTPVAMADVLKEHIEHCPEHPLAKAKAEIAVLKTTNKVLQAQLDAADLLAAEAARFEPEYKRQIESMEQVVQAAVTIALESPAAMSWGEFCSIVKTHQERKP